MNNTKSSLGDERLYLFATHEFDTKRNEALWAKALTLCEGDSERAKFKYILFRVNQLKRRVAAGSEKSRPLAEPTTEDLDAPAVDHVALADFAAANDLHLSEVMEKIESGELQGKRENGYWYIEQNTSPEKVSSTPDPTDTEKPKIATESDMQDPNISKGPHLTDLGMRWFNFWTYLAIPLFIGSQFYALPYSYNAIFLSAIILNLILLATTFFALIKRKVYGYYLNWFVIILFSSYYTASFLITLNAVIDSNGFYLHKGVSETIFILILGALLYPNFLYWPKRKHLFN